MSIITPPSTVQHTPNFFRTVFDVSNEAIVIHDATTGVILDCNRRFREMFGFSEQEASIISLEDISSGEAEFTADNARQKLTHANQYGALIFQWLARHRLGKTFWVEINFKRVVFDDSPYIIAFIHDITDIKLADQSLIESEKKWRVLAEIVPDIILMLDRHGKILFINHVLPGYERGQIIGASVYDLQMPQYVAPMKHCIQQIFETGELVAFEHIARREPDQWRFYSSRITPIKEDNAVVAALIISTDVTEQKQAQEALLKSEEKFSKAFYSSPDAVMITRVSDGKILEFNEGLSVITGYDKKELAGNSTLKLDIWASPSQRDEAINILMRNRHLKDFEADIRTKSGDIRVCLTSMEIIEIEQTNCIVSVSRDITEQKQAVATLRRSQQELKDRNSSLATIKKIADRVYGARHIETVAKEAVEAMLRYTSASSISFLLLNKEQQTLEVICSSSFSPEYDGLKTAIPINDSLSGITVQQKTVVCSVNIKYDKRFNQNTKRWLLKEGCQAAVSVPLLFNDEVLGVINIFFNTAHSVSDIEKQTLQSIGKTIGLAVANAHYVSQLQKEMQDRRVAEETLQVSQKMLQLVLHHIPTRVFWKDRNLSYLGCNQSFAQDACLDNPAQIVGKSDYDMPWSKHAEFIRKDDLQVISAEESKLNFEQMYNLNDGKTVWLETSKIPLTDIQGNIIGVLGTYNDITSRIEAKKELKKYREHLEDLVEKRTNELTQVNQELEAFSYSVSHDLRAPLRAIDGFSLALIEDYDNVLDEGAKSYLQRVRGAAQRMSQLIDDLLKLSRLTRGELKREKVDLSELARDIIVKLQHENSERSAEFRITSGMYTVGDEGLLRVMLDNLLSNAWKYSSKVEHTVIQFHCRRSADESVYCVEDNGIGFNMQYVDKLFGAFQRLHHVDEFQGSGIGLATVARIVHRHGGQVWAQGEEQQGARFYFSLPNISEL